MKSLLLAALVLSCPLAIPEGMHHVILTSYYSHAPPTDSPEPTYTSSASGYYIGPGIADETSEGHPVAHEWWLDGVLVKRCGEPPAGILFIDGFESGNTGRWN